VGGARSAGREKLSVDLLVVRDGVTGRFVYAILITLAVIFATMAVSRAAERAKKREEERSRGLFGR
jgi:Family of unknown function (DUF5654)